MPVERVRITDEQRDLVLRQSEGHFLEVKSIEVLPARLSKTVAAFANADGGELYIGIDEDKTAGRYSWRGFPTIEAGNSHLQVFEDLFPLGTDFAYTFLECEGYPGIILRVSVLKTGAIKKATDGQIYLRRGAQNLPVSTPSAVKQLEYTKGLSSFESELLNVDSSLITNSIPIIEFMLKVVPTADPAAWLSKQQVLRDGRPTVAGVVLFAEEPQALLPKRCGIKVYRYRTKDSTGSRETLAADPSTVEGHAYSQIREAVSKTTSVIGEVRKLGSDALETIEYPPDTLHEIITNAVLHRDYSVADDIHVRVYDNRIEVESPGRLPAHITPRNILTERFARNGTIVRLINKFPNPPNKDVGEGLNTAFAAMTKLGLKEPVIVEKENSVLVTIKHEPLASPEEMICVFLETHVTIRNKEAREISFIHEDHKIRSIFKRLVKRELLEKVPGTDRSTTTYARGRQFLGWKRTVDPRSTTDDGLAAPPTEP